MPTSLQQRLKDRLVALGPDNALTRAALTVHGKRSGHQIAFQDHRIHIKKEDREVILRAADYTLVPIFLENFDAFCESIAPERVGDSLVLDYSAPGKHRYTRLGIDFMFPGIPEDDSTVAYTHAFRPQEGMSVFDVGAHAGFTTYFLSKMVGSAGTVHAFEPDDVSRHYLEQNIAEHGLTNVTVVNMALSDRTGTAEFNMNGSVGASLVDCAMYPGTGDRKMVPTITLEEYCRRSGVMPDFVKMDIEGSEVGVIETSLKFLAANPIHMAFDSYHRTRDGHRSYEKIEVLLRSIGYHVESSDQYGEMFTWATPPSKSDGAQ